uniref:DUF834 domain-containing protein n=1 Tax=Oryza meridionalis TaxID=40149 RepID=A0A0E0EV67_9ORYZ
MATSSEPELPLEERDGRGAPPPPCGFDGAGGGDTDGAGEEDELVGDGEAAIRGGLLFGGGTVDMATTRRAITNPSISCSAAPP